MGHLQASGFCDEEFVYEGVYDRGERACCWSNECDYEDASGAYALWWRTDDKIPFFDLYERYYGNSVRAYLLLS